MLHIIVSKPDVREMKGVGKASGKPYHMAFQEAHIFTVGPDGKPNQFPDKIELVLERDGRGEFIVHKVGKYTLHPSSIQVGRDGLVLRPVLTPAGASANPVS